MSVGLRLALQEQRADDLSDRVRRLLGPFSGTELALDSGCGTGAFAFALAPRVGKVVGVDMNADYLEAARERAPENVRLVEGDATSLPFEYGRFDISGCLRVLHHVRRPELAISELARVTRPGGRILIADQLGSVDPLRSLELDRFERLRDPSHQRAPSRRRHPRLPRHERPRARLVRRRTGANRPRGAVSRSPSCRRRSAFQVAAGPPVARSTTSRSAGTSLARRRASCSSQTRC